MALIRTSNAAAADRIVQRNYGLTAWCSKRTIEVGKGG